ncbi:tetratricopeptide repeat protein, partial [Nonomuraea sp. NPDC050404]|uniref:tetratricopeptide repeat protein n=1 Tax=Nonomuraea sp. NPDC050404 TaxID=3155783 RepID=UPI0033F6C5C1
PVAEEAVAILRELAAAYPDRYRPDLATSLTNLGNRFLELGRPADALPVAEEAVAILRELAMAYPDRYRPDLATSLTNLGVTFAELGRPAEAEEMQRGAEQIRADYGDS